VLTGIETSAPRSADVLKALKEKFNA